MINSDYNSIIESFHNEFLGKNLILVLRGHNGYNDTICHYAQIKYYNIRPSDTIGEVLKIQNTLNLGMLVKDTSKEPYYTVYGCIDLDKFKLKPIKENEVVATFSRQLTKYNNIEKYTREKNYPAQSYVVSIDDIETLGLRAFFFSDASSAIKTEIFKKLNGYDNRDLPISEDMYIAYKIITNGYKIKYCSESVVYHSHNFSLMQLYKRYYETGVFFKQNNYLDQYGTNKTGSG